MNARNLDYDLWAVANQPNPQSVLALVPEEIRKIGLKVSLGYRLGPKEQKALEDYRSSGAFVVELLKGVVR